MCVRDIDFVLSTKFLLDFGTAVWYFFLFFFFYFFFSCYHHIVVVIIRYLDLQLPVKSVPSTTNVVSSNTVHGEVYLIQHYVIKVVSDLRQVGGFLRIL